VHAPVAQQQHARITMLMAERERRRQRKLQARRGGLVHFVRYFWHVLEPATPFVDGMPIYAICEHLEAITFGDINRLLINVPPGFCKSLLVNVFHPAWEWGPMNLPHQRFVAFSYSSRLTERDNGKFRNLIQSEAYQLLWGDRFAVDKTGELKISNDRTGWKLATSIGGLGTGERGDRVVCDDPHNVKDIESDVVREETARWFRESMSNRLNNPKTSAIIVIMQRLHENDVSGLILSEEFDYCHLMIPHEFSPAPYPVRDGRVVYEGNKIGWIDPRALDENGELLPPAALDEQDGVLAWPERFDEEDVETFRQELGPYGFSGQHDQSPVSRKGGIFALENWQLWEEPENGKFPTMDFIIASLDSAFTEKEENDPSGFTVWGVWRDAAEEAEDLGRRLRQPGRLDRNEMPTQLPGPKLMLMHAWRKHLKIHGPDMPRRPNETYAAWVQRTRKHWGLVEWVADTCKRFNVDMLLIEAKASGIDVINEMRRLHGDAPWGLEGAQAPSDKVARALSIQPIFAQEIVYAPARDWAEMVKNEMATFPKGRYKDLTDSAAHALKWLRIKGLIQRPEEIASLVRARAQFRKKPAPLYAV
jgi:predicted phage terminase large subunit-like protein